jgi:septal ring factor EnvC (AmiA/AmiB activator)
MVESTLLKNKDIIYIVIIFVFITASAGSLFAGWKHIKYLESERDLLKSNNKELLKEKESLDKILKERKKELEKVLDERKLLEVKIAEKEKELKEIDIEYEKDIIDIADSNINGDIGEVSNIFSNHSRR